MTAPLGITVGDPAGVGPEVVCAAIERMDAVRRGDLLLIGDQEALLRAAELVGIDPFAGENPVAIVDTGHPGGIPPDGAASAAGGAAAYAAVVRAVELAQAGEIAAIVTAPLSKEALHMAGRKFEGHTGLLAHLCGVRDPFMMLAAPDFSVVHVSAHLSLAEAIAGVSTDRVLAATRAGDAHLRRMGIARPRVAVAGLNPHAGEAGILGEEEQVHIAPAIERACKEGIDAVGPCPPDVVFRDALAGRFDLVVAQYHDQGHIPVKLVAFETAVNVTLGLPLVRVSVDHGTAFDIAWQGKARPENLLVTLDYGRKIIECSSAMAAFSGDRN